MSNTNTPLHLAVQNGNIEIVKMLLDAGHDLNAVNADDLTPLQLAIQLGHTEIVTLLSEKNKKNRSVPPPRTFYERSHIMSKNNNQSFWIWVSAWILGIGLSGLYRYYTSPKPSYVWETKPVTQAEQAERDATMRNIRREQLDPKKLD